MIWVATGVRSTATSLHTHPYHTQEIQCNHCLGSVLDEQAANLHTHQAPNWTRYAFTMRPAKQPGPTIGWPTPPYTYRQAKRSVFGSVRNQAYSHVEWAGRHPRTHYTTPSLTHSSNHWWHPDGMVSTQYVTYHIPLHHTSFTHTPLAHTPTRTLTPSV